MWKNQSNQQELRGLLSVNRLPEHNKRQFFKNKNWPKKILNTPGSAINEIPNLGTATEKLAVEYREVQKTSKQLWKDNQVIKNENFSQKVEKTELYEEMRFENESKKKFRVKGSENLIVGVTRWKNEDLQNLAELKLLNGTDQEVLSKKDLMRDPNQPKVRRTKRRPERQHTWGDSTQKKVPDWDPDSSKKTRKTGQSNRRTYGASSQKILDAKIPIKEKTVAKILKKNKKRREKEVEGRMKKLEKQKNKKAFNEAEDLTEKLNEMNQKLDEYLKEKLNPEKRIKKKRPKKLTGEGIVNELEVNKEENLDINGAKEEISRKPVLEADDYPIIKVKAGDLNEKDFVIGRRQRVLVEDDSDKEIQQIVIESQELIDINRKIQLEVNSRPVSNHFFIFCGHIKLIL